MPAAAIGTNSLLARWLELWIIRATSSLPEPGGPAISTRLLAGATLVMICRSCWQAWEWPIRPSGVRLWARSRRFSRRSCEASRAR